MGYQEYIPLSSEFMVPIVVTGFEPFDIVQGIYMTVSQLEKGTYKVENQYKRAVNKEGNLKARELMNDVFDVTDRQWRGIGVIPDSGLRLSEAYRDFDAETIFNVENIKQSESELCIAGEILQGFKRPDDCGEFGNRCTPEHPLGAPMVSTEGACAAYYRYRKIGSN
jgi:hydrogenase expression/formation protein HypD